MEARRHRLQQGNAGGHGLGAGGLRGFGGAAATRAVGESDGALIVGGGAQELVDRTLELSGLDLSELALARRGDAPALLGDDEAEGVGALGDCVAALRASKLDDTVRGWIKDGRPFLGVCLGMQALFETSEEGGVTGLGIFPGKVVRFRRPPEFKIPHMGWNTITFTQPNSPLAASLKPSGENVYFVHSFHCVPADPSLVLAECDYGGAFTAAIGRGNCFATQFHPEKSQAKGLQIYKNFADVAAGVTA